MPKPPLYVIINNHFDPTWRRCFDRRFEHEGLRYASYADIEAAYILENLRIADDEAGYRFEVESPVVLRKFLERYSDHLPRLRKLVDEGRFMVSGAGDNIIDSNMVHGESLVRNFVDGTLWTEKTLGRRPKVAVRNDAFGNSAQLPQVLLGCGFSVVSGLSYTLPNGNFWRGLDGSIIRVKLYPTVGYCGGVTKYPPCAKCSGHGCENCGGWGFDPSKRASLPDSFNLEKLRENGGGFLTASPEELLPNPAMVEWVRKCKDVDARFALLDDILEEYLASGGSLEPGEGDTLHPDVELNPNNSGCLVTRIQTKQTCRRQEYALLGVEALCALARLQGAAYPRTQLQAVWRDLFFTQFHDAITATHIDAAYEELKEYWERIDKGIASLRAKALRHLAREAKDTLSVVNATGDAMTEVATLRMPQRRSTRIEVMDMDGKVQKMVGVRKTEEGIEADVLVADLPAFSSRTFKIRGAKEDPCKITAGRKPVIENNRYRIEADQNGMVRITDKALGKDICRADQYRPAEFILEHDEGSPWATLSEHRPRLGLAATTGLTGVEKGRHFQRLIFAVGAPSRAANASGHAVQGILTVTLVDGLDRVNFHFETHWSGFNHRLRVAFPVPRKGRHFYSIPYGVLERKPYEPSFNWIGVNGDWPAIEWAGVQAPGMSVALLNKGLPANTIEPGEKRGDVLLLSLLRSPAVPTYLHEPQYYSMTAYDGMRDEGCHAFDFALTSFGSAFSQSDVVARAASYNAGLLSVEGKVDLPDAPRVEGQGVRITACKGSESGSHLLVRLVECQGKDAETQLRLPEGIRVAEKTNLLEETISPLEITDGKVKLSLRPWEIATVAMKR